MAAGSYIALLTAQYAWEHTSKAVWERADAIICMQHTHIKGLAAKLAGFEAIVEDIRHRPYALLDFEATQFDRDYLEFNVHIHDLELTLQVRCMPLPVLCDVSRAVSCHLALVTQYMQDRHGLWQCLGLAICALL